jgi:glycosyltransferase involved in cell wall biosynthesis
LSESLSIVVPAYNEGGNLAFVVDQIARQAARSAPEHEIVIVDDGSTDDTLEVAHDLAARLPRVRVVAHATNQGSGGAILTGIAHARCQLVMYIPADGQFHLPEIADFLRAIAGHDIVIGARVKRSDYSWFRRLSSRVFILLVNRLFRQSFQDVNWVHMWRRRIFEKIAPRSRGVFMLEEILVRARRAGFEVAEIQSFYIPRRSGQAKGGDPRTILRTIFEMLRFWLELRGGAGSGGA